MPIEKGVHDIGCFRRLRKVAEKKKKGNSVKGKRLDKMKKTEKAALKAEKKSELKKNASVSKTDSASSAGYILVKGQCKTP